MRQLSAGILLSSARYRASMLPTRAIRRYREYSWKSYSGHPVLMATGASLSLNPECAYSRSLFLRRQSEIAEARFISSSIAKGSTAIDGGANVGYFTTLLSDVVGREGRVLAFEPDPRPFRYLEKNIAFNGCRNVHAYPFAISDKKGSETIYLSGNHTGDTRLYEPEIDRPDEPGRRNSLEIEAVALDEFTDCITNVPQVLIKFDLQGYEVKALRGATNFIQACNQLIILTEYWPNGLLQAGASPEEFWAYCQESNLLVNRLSDGSVTPVNLDEFGEITVRLIATGLTMHTSLILMNREATSNYRS